MVSRSTLLIWSICSLGTMLGGIKVRAGPLYCLLFCTRYRIMVLLTLNKKDLWKQCSGSFSGLSRRAGEGIKGLWPLKGSLSFFCTLISVSECILLEVSPSHHLEDPRNQNWKEASEGHFAEGLHRRLWAFCFSISSLQKDLWTWLPLQHPHASLLQGSLCPGSGISGLPHKTCSLLCFKHLEIELHLIKST